MNFTKNVFINCPLDPEYIPLLKCLLFTIKKIGLIPRLALGETRFWRNKITENRATY